MVNRSSLLFRNFRLKYRRITALVCLSRRECTAARELMQLAPSISACALWRHRGVASAPWRLSACRVCYSIKRRIVDNARARPAGVAAFLSRICHACTWITMRNVYIPPTRDFSLIQMDLKTSLLPRRQNKIAPIKAIGDSGETRTRHFYDPLHISN